MHVSRLLNNTIFNNILKIPDHILTYFVSDTKDITAKKEVDGLHML